MYLTYYRLPTSSKIKNNFVSRPTNFIYDPVYTILMAIHTLEIPCQISFHNVYLLIFLSCLPRAVKCLNPTPRSSIFNAKYTNGTG